MPESEEFDARPDRAFVPRADLRVDESRWPASDPRSYFRHLLDDRTDGGTP